MHGLVVQRGQQADIVLVVQRGQQADIVFVYKIMLVILLWLLCAFLPGLKVRL